MHPFELGAFFFGGVEMDDAGAGPPAPMDRRYSNEQCGRRPTDYVELGGRRPSGSATTRSGRPSTTSSTRATRSSRTASSCRRGSPPARERIRLGTMFNVVPQWNPLRLAEDFSTLHNLSGGRGDPRRRAAARCPARCCTSTTRACRSARTTTPTRQADDDRNREVFEESMEIVRLALDNETFSFHGQALRAPGRPASPIAAPPCSTSRWCRARCYPYEIWQAVTSPPTLEYVPVVGHGAVFWNQHHAFIKRFWDTYGERYAAAHDGRSWRRTRSACSSSRCASRTPTRRPCETATPGHDEFWKFLGPYGWSRGYMGDDGKPAKPGLIPTLDESIENKTILLGTPEEVAEGIAVLPRPARPRAPDDLPAPARRPVQEGRRADGPLHRRGPAAGVRSDSGSFCVERVSATPMSDRSRTARERRSRGPRRRLADGRHQYNLRADSSCMPDRGVTDAAREAGAAVHVVGVLETRLAAVTGPVDAVGGDDAPDRNPARIRVTRSVHNGGHARLVELAAGQVRVDAMAVQDLGPVHVADRRR